MKVGYVINRYPCPSHTFIRREIQALERRGIEVARFSFHSDDVVDPLDKEELKLTRTIRRAGAAQILLGVVATVLGSPILFLRGFAMSLRLGWRSERGVWLHLAYLLEACVLRRWMSLAKVEHVHAHFGTNSTTVVMLAQVLGGPPFSFTVHGPEEFDKPEGLRLREKIERAKFVVGVSDFARAQLCRWSPYWCWKKIAVVRCGIDLALLPATPVPDERRLIAIGRYGDQKGHLLLLDAAARLRDQGVPFRLDILGDGPLRAAMEERMRMLSLSEVVTLTGWLDDRGVRDGLGAARGLVLASFAEGLPVVLLEAFAYGRPVVATWVAGIPELVQDHVNGWTVQPGSEIALADAMRSMLEAPLAELQRMADAGRARVGVMHNLEREAEKLAALFEKAIASGPRRSAQ